MQAPKRRMSASCFLHNSKLDASELNTWSSRFH